MIISKNDNRKYKLITLNNKLQVMLIYDKMTKISASSMNVGIGCFQDPVHLPGLAHFLEHMLFMGTEKYPLENDFSDYLSKYNGSYNAYTSQVCTNYYFSISSQKFSTCLDKFAQFFISPLFNKGAINRELNAINSEHSKNIQNDFRRTYGVLREIVNKENPFHKFCTGTLETLQKDTLYDELLQFYNKWYSANIMKLVILDNKPLDVLEKLIKKLFSSIKNGNVHIPLITAPYFKGTNIQINIEPISNINDLLLVIPIKTNNNHIIISCLYFISELISYSGENSFVSFLKKEQLANNISCDIDNNGITDTLLFVHINLLKNGINKTNIILNHFINYVTILQQFNEPTIKSHFVNFEKINILNFTFRSKEDPIDYVSSISDNMHFLPNKYHLTSYNIYHKYDHTIIKQLFAQLHNFVTCIIGPFKTKHYNVEQFYKVKYTVNKGFTKTKKNKLYISLPITNEFINVNLTLLKDVKHKYPIKLIQNKYLELWYKHDYTFNKPFCLLNINCLTETPSIHNYILGSLLSLIKNNIIYEKLYGAYLLNMTAHISYNIQGFNIKIGTYNSTMNLLLLKTLDIIVEPILEQDFNNSKELLVKYYNNIKFRTPLDQAFIYIRNVLVAEDFAVHALIEELNKITFIDMQKYTSTVFKKLYSKILVQGNITSINCSDLATTFYSKISYEPIISVPIHIIKLNIGRYGFNIKCLSDENDSGVISLYQCTSITEQKTCIAFIIYLMLKDPFFDILRTNEQLGYLVGCKFLLLDKSTNILFKIQSSNKSPIFIQSRIDLFIKTFYKTLNKMTNENINVFIQSAIDTNKIKFINLEEEFIFNKHEIDIEEFQFNRKLQNIHCFKQITKSMLIKYYKHYLMSSRRNLLIHIHGKSSDNKIFSVDNKITDITKFKKNKTDYII